MAKSLTSFICQQCSASFPKWLGQCPQCSSWGSLVETILEKARPSGSLRASSNIKVTPIRLPDIAKETIARIHTGIGEFDRVLGGGIVPGMVVLIAGEPGIGKSTLLLELAAKLSNGIGSRVQGLEKNNGEADSKLSPKPYPLNPGVLYVAGEESPGQIKVRADRLGLSNANIAFLAITDVDAIIAGIEQIKPKFVIVDSIQTLSTTDLTSSSGSVGQVRECSDRLTSLAKRLHIPMFIIGHVTREGSIAGPKVLEHIVDTVLVLEGDYNHNFRILRAEKNRFGSTDEIGVFSMEEEGLKEVANASQAFLSERLTDVPGSIVVPTMEGTRTILVEIQALTAPTTLAMPRRVGIGVDYNRLQLLLALLSRRFNSKLAQLDVFVNVAGGLKINEPALDLGICLAIVSAFNGVAIPSTLTCFGEVGLLGEVRSVRFAKQRALEAGRQGFTTILSPQAIDLPIAPLRKSARLQANQVKSIQQAITMAIKDKK